MAIIFDITNVYGPNDKIPNNGNNNNGVNTNGPDWNNKDNYGSGNEGLKVEDLDKDKLGNIGFPPNNNNNNNNNGNEPDGGNDNNNTGEDNGSGNSNSGSGNNGNGNNGSGTGGNGGSSNGNGENSNDPNGGANSPCLPNGFLDEMALILDTAFQTLTPSTPNILLLPAMGTLRLCSKLSVGFNPLELATRIATYFSLTIIPKPMGVAGPVVLCTNTAMTIIPKLTADLISLSQSGTDDNFESFVQTIYNNIANGAITWNVTEQVGQVQVPYVVTVS